jgi:hypothetical protein
MEGGSHQERASVLERRLPVNALGDKERRSRAAGCGRSGCQRMVKKTKVAMALRMPTV